MPRDPRSNSPTKKNDDRSGSRSSGGMKSQGNRMDDRETRQGKSSNDTGGTPRKSNGRFSSNKRGH